MGKQNISHIRKLREINFLFRGKKNWQNYFDESEKKHFVVTWEQIWNEKFIKHF